MGIGSVSGLGNIQTYPVREIPKVSQNNADELQINSSNLASEKIVISNDQSAISNKRESIEPTALQDISIGFNKNNDYAYIGKDADVGLLDMEQAISDMKKDSLFQEYQYFVGTINQ